MIMVNIFINFFIDSVFCKLCFIHKSIIRYGNTKNAKLDDKIEKTSFSFVFSAILQITASQIYLTS